MLEGATKHSLPPASSNPALGVEDQAEATGVHERHPLQIEHHTGGASADQIRYQRDDLEVHLPLDLDDRPATYAVSAHTGRRHIVGHTSRLEIGHRVDPRSSSCARWRGLGHYLLHHRSTGRRST